MGNALSNAVAKAEEITENQMKNETTSSDLFSENKEEIKVNVKVEASDKKEDEKNKNTFYELLQNDYFDSDNREAKIVNVPGVKLNMKKNLSSIYNCGGNLRIECDIPTSKDNFPNYSKVILSKNEVGDSDEVNLIKILTTFMTDENFLTTYYYDNKLVSENGVPLINLKDHIGDNQKIVNGDSGDLKICWNWNAKRNYKEDKDRVNGMINYYMFKFNELIDYIINNDLVGIDSEFSKKFISLFMDTSEKLNNYSNGTLLLPSLINWLSSKLNGGKSHALSMCGFIGRGSKIFPISGVDEKKKWNEIVKWSKDKDEFTPRVNVPMNINDGIIMSKFNYPFYSKYWDVTNVSTDAPKVDFELNDESISKFTKDNYPDSSESILKIKKYAIRNEVGTIANKNTIERDNATISIEFKATSASIDEIYNMERVNLERMVCKEYGGGVKGKDCLRDTIWATSDDGKLTYTKTYSQEYDVYTLKNPNDIKDSVFAQIKYINKNIYPNPKILRVKNKRIDYSKNVDVVNGNKYIKDVNVGNTHQNYGIKKTYNLKWDTVCDGDEPKTYDGSVCKVGKSLAELGYHNIVYPMYITLTAELDIEYDKSGNKRVYKGPGSSGFESTNNKDDRLICMCETNYDLYFFNDNVFKYWISLIKNKGNQQFILNNLREYIKNHPELILMNKVNRCIGEYARGFGGPVMFMNNPLGPALFNIPKSFVIPYKYYYPTFKIDNKVDEENIKYDKSKVVNDIVNSVSCNEDSNNYLDVLFRSVIEESKVNEAFDKDLIISVTLPTRGSQIFEVISKSLSSLVPSGYAVSVSKISDTDLGSKISKKSMILLSFKDFGVFKNDTKLSTLLSEYDLMTKLSVPLMTISRDNNDNYFTHLMINTMNNLKESDETTGTNNSDDSNNLNENIVYIYVSKNLSSDIKGLSSEDSGGNVDKNNINNIVLNVGYDGINSYKTSNCLRLRDSLV